MESLGLASAHLGGMDENQSTQTRVVEALPEGTPVRYAGSLEEYRGLTGKVTASYDMWGEVLHSIVLDLPGAGVQDLHRVRRQSITVIEEQN